MGSDTRLLPSKKPSSTGIAQTQMVNRPATMGVGNNSSPVSASPAAGSAIRAHAAAAAPRAQPMRIMAGSSGAVARPVVGGSAQRGTRLPGPPGSAVASVELLPNVTKGAAALPARPASTFSIDELMLLAHLVDEFAGDPTNESNRELAEGARGKLADLMDQIG